MFKWELRGSQGRAFWTSVNMTVCTCGELKPKHNQISCYLRPPFLGAPLGPSRPMVPQVTPQNEGAPPAERWRRRRRTAPKIDVFVYLYMFLSFFVCNSMFPFPFSFPPAERWRRRRRTAPKICYCLFIVSYVVLLVYISFAFLFICIIWFSISWRKMTSTSPYCSARIWRVSGTSQGGGILEHAIMIIITIM